MRTQSIVLGFWFQKQTLALVFYSEFWEISKSTFFTEHLRWLLLWFVLVASIVVTWVSWFNGQKFKLEDLDFIFHILQRNFPNFGVKILALCSPKVFEVFIFPYFVLIWYILVQSMELFKVWLKLSENGYFSSFSIHNLNYHPNIFEVAKSTCLRHQHQFFAFTLCFEQILQTSSLFKKQSVRAIFIMEKNMDIKNVLLYLARFSWIYLKLEWNIRPRAPGGCFFYNPLSAYPTKWSNTPKQFVGNSRRIEYVWSFCGVDA